MEGLRDRSPLKGPHITGFRLQEASSEQIQRSRGEGGPAGARGLSLGGGGGAHTYTLAHTHTHTEAHATQGWGDGRKPGAPANPPLPHFKRVSGTEPQLRWLNDAM